MKVSVEVVMTKEFGKRFKAIIAPAALAIALVAFSPSAALAQNHGRRDGHGSAFNRGHSFSGPARGNFNGGRVYGERSFYGGRPYYRGPVNRYVAPRYYRPGFGFSFGIGTYAAPYSYAAPYYGSSVPVCNPAGYYDGAGYWQYYPGCVAPPYGY